MYKYIVYLLTFIIAFCISANARHTANFSLTFNYPAGDTFIIEKNHLVASHGGNNGPAGYNEDQYDPTFVGLPVKLKLFKATRIQNQVKLTWETTMERLNTGFDIERKTGNSQGFVTVGHVATKAVNGHSDISLTYEFTDPNHGDGSVQYRLKQIDKDGKINYSSIRLVSGLREKAKSIMYPNPANNGNTHLVFSNTGNRHISIINMNGQVERQYKNYTNLDLQIKDLQKGIYLVSIIYNTNNQLETIKVVVP